MLLGACAGPGRAVTGGVHWGVRSVCAGGVRARPRRGLHCRVSAGRGGRGWASGAEAAVWVGVCLPGAGGGHRGAGCCCDGGMRVRRRRCARRSGGLRERPRRGMHWCHYTDLSFRLFAVCVCVWVCVGGRMHAITHTLGVHRRPPIAPPRAVTVEAQHNRFARGGAEHGSVTKPVFR